MALTPTSVSVVTAGRERTVRTVSLLLLLGTDGSRVRARGRAGITPSLGGSPFFFFSRDFYYGGCNDLLYLLGIY